MKAKANANAGQLNPKDTEIPDTIVFFCFVFYDGLSSLCDWLCIEFL